MDKFLAGVLNYQKLRRSVNLNKLKTALTPTCLIISCMDSRVSPTKFAALSAGQSFIMRNAGNCIPTYKYFIDSKSFISSEPGGIELACVRNNVQDILVCGHSDCKALGLVLQLAASGKANVAAAFTENSLSPLERWVVQQAGASLAAYRAALAGEQGGLLDIRVGGEKWQLQLLDSGLNEVDTLSQVHILQQLANLADYPGEVGRRVASGHVRLHGLWVQVGEGGCGTEGGVGELGSGPGAVGEVHLYSQRQSRFVEVDEELVNEWTIDKRQVQKRVT